MHNSHTKDLFQLQTELIEMKVDMAVSKTIDRAIMQLSDLISGVRDEVHELRGEMNARFSSVDSRISSVENRLIAVETKLGIKNVFHTEVRSRTLDYSFKAGWLALGGAIMYGMVIIHAFLVK